MQRRIEERWTELVPLLDQLLDLPVDQRAAAITALDGDDELRELLRNLAARMATTGILDGDSGRYAKGEIAEESTAVAPAQVGPYRIVRLIGQGGSGSVFLAERDADGYVQSVALKLLRTGMHDPIEQDRFRRERRILARLEHPRIARLLDAGFTNEGVPWFAMEYVDGQSLTSWCDQRRLDVPRRLRLFDEVCVAVTHAHRALIIHRDLKPANILVDAEGRPHLLDFGIARLLDAGIDDDVTRTGLRRLTPAYAAPEQFDGGVISTATDVYALGVLLHELLTGLRPVGVDGDGSHLASTTFFSDGERDALAVARDTTAKTLRRKLRGDLDTVIATALEHDPRRRYSSVETFAAELRRFLDGHPITARRASLPYRIRKFVGRQRLAVALASLLVISLIAGIAATLRETRHAQRAATAAMHEAARADSVKDFVLALFAGVTPDESRGREIGAKELLERGSARLTETLAAQPQLEADLSTVLASAWRQLGSLDRAATLAERAVAVAVSPTSRFAANGELAAVRNVQGQFEEAEAALRAAMAQAPDAGAKGDAQVRLAELLADRGHPDHALALLKTVLDADRDDPAHLSRDTAALGRVRFRAGDLEGAQTALRDALDMSRSLQGERHTVTATREHDLAVVLLQRGATADAAALLDQALATRVALLGERHPDVAQSRFNLAVARQRLGEGDAARALYRSALVSQRELLGENHPDVASSLNSLAMLDYQQGHIDDAIKGLREALVAARGAYGNAHPTVATMLGNLASIERAAGRIDDAERDQRDALLVTEAALGPDHYLNGVGRLGLAGALIEKGKDAEAIDEQRTAVTILEKGLGPDHADVVQARAALADSLLRSGKLDEAQAALPDAGSSPAQKIDPRGARVEVVRLRIAQSLGNCAVVVARLPAVIDALSAGGGGLRADVASAELLFANCLRQQGAARAATAAIARGDSLIAQLPYVARRLHDDRAALR